MFRQLRTLSVLALVLFLAVGCGRRAQPTPTPTLPPPTNTPVPPTATVAPPTSTTVPATNTPVPPTATTAPATNTPAAVATGTPATTGTAATGTPAAETPAATTTAAATTGTPGTPEADDEDEVEGDADNGQTLFTNGKGAAVACVTCHTAEEGGAQLVGPPLWGVADRAETRVPGMSAAEYLHQSIVDPNAHVVEGFASGLMPDVYDTNLTEDEIQDLIAFLFTLRD